MITIIDFGDKNSLDVADAISKLTKDYIVSGSEVEICEADKIIFPGCGKAPQAMKKIHLLNLFSVLRIIKKPMLGIGLGMQLMADYTTEGNITCLGLIPGSTVKFNSGVNQLQHKGFFKVNPDPDNILFKDVNQENEFYFEHSYYIPQGDYTTSTCGDELVISSSLQKENSYAVQFHPERSGEAGLTVLKNFMEL